MSERKTSRLPSCRHFPDYIASSFVHVDNVVVSLHYLHERFCAATGDSPSLRCSSYQQEVSQRLQRLHGVLFDCGASGNLDVDAVGVLGLEQPASRLPAYGTKTACPTDRSNLNAHTSSRRDSTERFVLAVFSRWECCCCDSNSMCSLTLSYVRRLRTWVWPQPPGQLP